MSLDIERMALRFARRNNLNVGMTSLADFGRQVARACARVADATPESKKHCARDLDEYPRGVRDGHMTAAFAIRRALRRPRRGRE